MNHGKFIINLSTTVISQLIFLLDGGKTRVSVVENSVSVSGMVCCVETSPIKLGDRDKEEVSD